MMSGQGAFGLLLVFESRTTKAALSSSAMRCTPLRDDPSVGGVSASNNL
jgi:hypothetical protein